MEKKIFNSDYNEYWKDRVKNKKNDSKVPDEKIFNFIINYLNIHKNDRVLDLGCGFGRFFSILKKSSNNIFGIDVDLAMINNAKKYPYISLSKGSAEESNFPSDYFNHVISWAVFDVVDQKKALFEGNRILKTGGKYLLTGKNFDYFEDDNLAFIAERNAKLKDFPNHFTYLNKLIKNIDDFGFEVLNTFAFLRRGDFSEKKFIELKGNKETKFYEYIIILKRIKDIEEKIEYEICSDFSNVALKLADKNGFKKDIINFFKKDKEKNN